MEDMLMNEELSSLSIENRRFRLDRTEISNLNCRVAVTEWDKTQAYCLRENWRRGIDQCAVSSPVVGGACIHLNGYTSQVSFF